MRYRLITAGTCAAMALVMTSAGGRVLASSDRQTWPALGQAAVPDPLSAWPGAGFPGDEQDLRSEASDRQTHTLAIGASGSLELKTVTGQITCVAGTGSSATVEVIRRSRGRTDADAKQGLVDVRAEIDHKGERATVVAVYPTGRQPRPYSVDVSYVVTAPAGTRVSASSVSGDVSVRDIKGDVSATSVSGHVSIANAAQVGAAKSVSGNVSIVGLSSSSAVNVGSVSGNVTFESVKATQINAESVSGSIRFVNGGTTTGVAFKSVSGNIDYEGAIGRGGRYELTSHSGNVRVNASAVGFELQASTFSGAIRTEPQQALRSATSSSRSVRGTVGDGSAVLAVTTFSGNITVVTR